MPVPTQYVFLEAAARATVILAAAGLVAAVLRRASASSRHLVWVLGLTSALVVPAVSMALPKWEVPIVRLAAAPSQQVNNAAVQPVTVRFDDVRGGQPARRSTDASSPRQSVMTSGQGAATTAGWNIASLAPGTILLLIWAAGASVVLGRMLVGLLAVQWMSRRTRNVTDGPWLALAEGLAADLGLTNVRFAQSATASMPMAWGVWRASVLMPADADAWPEHRLRVVLLHELAHVKRRDCLTHLVAQVVCAVYWFNPLAWVAARRLRSERERACDDLVLQAGTRGSDYADELLDIARVMQSQRFPAVFAGATLAMAHRSQLEGRLIAILDPTVPRRGLSPARAAAAAAVFAGLIFSVASVQPWAEERAVVNAVVVDGPQSAAEKPAQSSSGQSAVEANSAREERDRQATAQQRTQQRLKDHGPDGIVDGIADGIADSVSSALGNGIAGGVVGGVGAGIGRNVEKAVEQAVPMALAQVNPNPNPNPRPGVDGQKAAADPRAVAALMEALKDTDKEVRETAMHALVQMRDPRIFDPLVAALKDASPDVREQAVFGLGQLRDPRAVEPLMTVLHDTNADVREQAVFALGQLRDKRALDPLVAALKDENADVREQAAFGLGQIRDAKAVEALVIALKDGNADVREQAAFALGQIRDPRAIDGLTAAMKDSNAEVRKQAAFALGQIRY